MPDERRFDRDRDESAIGARDGGRIGVVRRGDMEPYTALRWVGSLFKAAAVFLIVAVVAEFIAGIRLRGWGVMPALLGEVARTVVLAIVLWGAGDLVRLLIHIGHDIRADRILMTRLVYRITGEGRSTAERWRGQPRLHEGARRPPPESEAAD